MASEPEEADKELAEEPSAGALVPFYAGTDIVPGVQAFRRGDIILYTVRGEPDLVQQLIGRLDREGIDEVVAFISHRADDEASAEVEQEPGEEDEE